MISRKKIFIAIIFLNVCLLFVFFTVFYYSKVLSILYLFSAILFLSLNLFLIGKLAEEALHKEREQISKLSQAVEQSPSTIIITDAKGAIEYVNPKFTQLTGYSFEEVVGKNPQIFKSGEHSREYYEKFMEYNCFG